MHIQTHILSGWVAGNALRLSPRERTFCMIAASIPDLDGLGILLSEELYWDLHHKLGHNVFFFVVVAAVCAAFSRHRLRVGLLCFALGWLHFTLDYLGSGPGWGLFPLWPVSAAEIRWAGAWPFFSWQNLGTFAVLLGMTLWIARQWGRTPLEAVMPNLDQQLVLLLRGRRSRPEGPAPSPAPPVTGPTAVD